MITKNEQRDEILRLIREENRSPKSLSEEFDIPIQTIYTWVRKERKEEITLVMNSPEHKNSDYEILKNRVLELEEKNRFLEELVRNLTESNKNLNGYLSLLREKYEQ